MINNLLFTFLIISFSFSIKASNKIDYRNKPKFAVIKSAESNIRTGPNKKYPIRWIYINANEPIEIIDEFEKWKKIRDYQGDEGWIHDNLLSYKRYVVVISKEDIILYNKPKLDAKSIAIIQPNVRANLIKCEENWCKLKLKKYQGWVLKKYLWGAE